MQGKPEEREELADWLEMTASNNIFGWTWDAVNAFKRSAAIIRGEQYRVPIDMILFCPACGTQHIDAPDGRGRRFENGTGNWDNPPHRSHLCHSCGYIWRPADVATNGVVAINTKGKADSPQVTPTKFPYAAESARLAFYEAALREIADSPGSEKHSVIARKALEAK